MRWTLNLLLILCLHIGLYAQNNEQVVYFHVGNSAIKKKIPRDSLLFQREWKAAVNEFRLNGYVNLTIKDTVQKSKATHYYFEYTKQFKKIVIKPSVSSEGENYHVNTFLGALNSINKTLKTLENDGYPFCTVSITDQNEIGEKLILTYAIDSGQYMVIDKIHLKSLSPFHTKTVLNLINIKTGEPYNESKIRALKGILENSELYTVSRSPEILFKLGKAEIYLYFDKKKSSNADGYIGFQQDPETESFALNGFVNLDLKNALNRAETIHLLWKNNPNSTQELRTVFDYPFLFSSPIGLASQINLQKQDTSFVRSDLLFELTYRTPTFKVSIFDQIEISNTLSSIPIPGFNDFNKNTIGVRASYKPILPLNLKFYHPKVHGMAGVFNYRTDTTDNELPNISNYKFAIGYAHIIDLFKFFHLNNFVDYQTLTSNVGISRSEMIYFGGLNSLRGFYELELFAKEIWTFRNELEFKPIDILSLKAIYDFSVFINDTRNQTHSIGFGFGIINNSSQLEIILANGVLNDNPLLLTNSKIHIGFKSNF
jgi:translocation and assembly module TamA